MISRRDALRAALLAVLAQPLLAACGSDDKPVPGPGPKPDPTGIDLVSSDLARAEGDAGAVPDVVAALQRLAGGIYAGLPSDENLVLSPYSIAVALGMTLAGAGGTTADEMREVLGADDRFHAGLNALTAHVEGLAGKHERADGSTAEIAIAAANQLFGQRGVAWEQAFLDLLAEEYGAGVRTVDFENATEEARLLINGWVADQTEDRIEDLIAEGMLDSASRLVLANAIYLKAPWEAPFEKEATTPGRFHLADGGTVDVDLMGGPPLYTDHGTGDGWQSARLPYAGGGLAMTVVLPDDGRLAEVERQVADGGLAALVAGGTPTALDVRLPRWTSRTSAGLADVLMDLGMRSAFDPSAADFTPMTEEDLALVVSAVVHQGFIAVDEDGTEAAAATAVAMSETAAPTTTSFHVDRPFLYVIHDAEHGTPLFLGRVLDPSA